MSNAAQYSITYMETGSTDPCMNLAFEEVVLNRRTQGDCLLLWQNDNTIVIGRNQNAEAEINREFVEAHGIKVVRRETGGGAVYHDMGNLNYSFITDSGAAERLTIERFTRPVVAALRGLGLDAEASGRNDILVSGRKVSGTAQRLKGTRILHHGTLLFDSDPEMAAGALNVDSTKFRSKSAKSVRSRIGNIRGFLHEDMTLPEFWDYLKKFLSGGDIIISHLTEEELAEAEKLRLEKYATWEWNFGRSPKWSVANKRKWDGGILETRVNVEHGKITDIKFYGDFLALLPVEPVAAALIGCDFRRESLAPVLGRFKTEEVFGTLTREEILDTIFYAD